ncbi:MAG TPA: PCYCGC motif-containing (lipo)protein [Aggregatilinea sp.]|uniref:PCYCGC motif-containing (lipo)protein n=1 Tax=Aggregatilinea sp. TaxID=2806333 RepID=UPI002C7C49C0|nr:PCYCGC motif-containing (lipo)protein [Aggregatilinea sp.]HML24525.1 PCYCGC motif-containing (lipo)protein [Aggregatilinea sp.]
MRPLTRLMSVVLLLVTGLILAGCGGSADEAPAVAALPDWVMSAPTRVREAYEYAVTNPEELAKYPCYCGCGAMGHTSNLSCYVQDIAPDGTITYDSHATGCGICVDIAQDVIRLKAQGQSSPEVRAYIDAQYSPFGPGTDTALPLD